MKIRLTAVTGLFAFVFLSVVLAEEGTTANKEGLVFQYYETGALKSAINYTGGWAHGLARRYFKNGQLYSEVQYLNGKREGIYKRYRQNGELVEEAPYVKGKRHGVTIIYSEGDPPWQYSKSPYSDGKLHGIATSYYPSGSVQGKTSYKEGMRHASGKVYYQDGTRKQESVYELGRPVSSKNFDENGRRLPNEFRDGVSWIYDKRGHLKETGEPVYEDDGLTRTIMRSYYPYKVLKSEVTVRESGGELGYCYHGPAKNYYETGQLKDIVHFADCVEHGEVKRFYVSGRLREDGEYVHGRLLRVKRFDRRGKPLPNTPAVRIEISKNLHPVDNELKFNLDNNLDKSVRLVFTALCHFEEGKWRCEHEKKLIGHARLPKGGSRLFTFDSRKLAAGRWKFKISYKNSLSERTQHEVYSGEVTIP